jgi:chromosome segregation ATPase
MLTTIQEHTTACDGECYEALSREQEPVRGELQENPQRLEENAYRIRSLEADMAALQRTCEENSTALAFAHRALRSCQAQLDNVQRFISTADTHADQDIIQKLQELNEEVYQMSMKMADYVAEGFARQSATARQMKENTSVGESVLATIGKIMVDHLAAVEGDEDTALFLQIAFQGYLSHLLCQIVSSWTIDTRLNALIEGTYQRLRKGGEIIRCSIHVKHSC